MIFWNSLTGSELARLPAHEDASESVLLVTSIPLASFVVRGSQRQDDYGSVFAVLIVDNISLKRRRPEIPKDRPLKRCPWKDEFSNSAFLLLAAVLLSTLICAPPDLEPIHRMLCRRLQSHMLMGGFWHHAEDKIWRLEHFCR